MYNYIIGKVVEKTGSYIVLENNGIGYTIYTPNPYVFKDDEVQKVYLYQQIKEDEHLLFGFKTPEEKDLFLKLISVKGMGPKMTLPMLATGSISGIVDAIERENILYLKKFPKIGEKVAKQMILDLKGKMGSISTLDLPDTNNYDELIEVLEGLGYKAKEFKHLLPQIDNTLSIEDQVKEALKLLLK
jgi:Holliday junction DNA helicase RuvA